MFFAKLLRYYRITLPYYAVTPFFADVSSIFHSLMPITLSHDYVFCKRLMRYYLVTLLRGSMQTCLPFSIRRYKSMFFFYTMDLFSFPARCILSFLGKFIDYMFYLVILFRYSIVLGHCCSHPLAVLSRELDFNNGMSKKHTGPENTPKGSNGPGIRRANHITLLRVIIKKMEKPGS